MILTDKTDGHRNLVDLYRIQNIVILAMLGLQSKCGQNMIDKLGKDYLDGYITKMECSSDNPVLLKLAYAGLLEFKRTVPVEMPFGWELIDKFETAVFQLADRVGCPKIAQAVADNSIFDARRLERNEKLQ